MKKTQYYIRPKEAKQAILYLLLEPHHFAHEKEEDFTRRNSLFTKDRDLFIIIDAKGKNRLVGNGSSPYYLCDGKYYFYLFTFTFPITKNELQSYLNNFLGLSIDDHIVHYGFEFTDLTFKEEIQLKGRHQHLKIIFS